MQITLGAELLTPVAGGRFAAAGINSSQARSPGPRLVFLGFSGYTYVCGLRNVRGVRTRYHPRELQAFRAALVLQCATFERKSLQASVARPFTSNIQHGDKDVVSQSNAHK